MKKLLPLLLLFLSLYSHAQKIYGVVFNEMGDLLPFASVTIKGTTLGASANNRAKFAIPVKPGTYTVVCQYIGYVTVETPVTIVDTDEEVVFVLKQLKLTLDEVMVKSDKEDPAYAIMRKAIELRTIHNKEVASFQCDLYTKNMIKVRRLPKKILGRTLPDEDIYGLGLDSTGKGIIYLSEAISKISKTLPDKIKMEVKSSRISGSDQFGLALPMFINFYDNNVLIFTDKVNPRGFVSPLASNAMNFYRFKFLGSFWENGKEINSIRITPKKQYEPLFSGVVNIVENEWRIHSINVTVNKEAQLDLFDSLKISQIHVPVSDNQWRIKNQLLHFELKQLGVDLYGNFLSVYSNYNLQPVFSKKFYDNVVIRYDTGVADKGKAYWESVRPVPLEIDEERDYSVKDSIFEIRKEPAYKQTYIDSMKARQGKIKWYKFFWGGVDRTFYGKKDKYDWGVFPLIERMEYNLAEGVVVNAGGYYRKYIKKWKTDLIVSPNLRYGFSNTHLNGWVDVTLGTREWETIKKIKQKTWYFSGGKRVIQFNIESPVRPVVNTFSTLFFGNNYMKTYESVFASAGFSKKFENGLKVTINGLYENRLPLDNTTDFIFFEKYKDNITPNYPYDKISEQFEQHQAVLMSVDFSIKPGQKYIEFPNKKVALKSKYPTFSLNYTKGIKNIFGSDVDFDKWLFTVQNDQNLRLWGTLRYKIGMGGFFNSNIVYIQDYRHFNGNKSIIAGEYLNSFQLAEYYENSTTATAFGIAHLEHHFNGFITSSIPVLNKLNWNIVTGSNAFFVSGSDNYFEMYVGLENILKVFRVDFVVALVNGGVSTTGVRIGAGGVLGSKFKTREYKRRETFGGGL